MKQTLLAVALFSAFGIANATNFGNTTNNNQTYNQGGNASAGASAVAGASASVGVDVDVKNSNTNLNSNTNHNANSNIQGQSTQNANNSNLSVDVDSARNAVNTAYAPSIAPTANCALSVSGGVQVMGFGGSFGKAYIDENCAALEKVRSVSQVLGDKATAEALMCQDVKYSKARSTAGRPCPVETE